MKSAIKILGTEVSASPFGIVTQAAVKSLRIPGPRLGGTALSVASLTLLFAVACGGGGQAPPTAAPSPTATSAAAAAPSATLTLPPGAATLASKLREIEDRVIAIRGLSRPDDVPERFVDPAQMQALIDEELADPETVEDFDNAERLYKLLGLIPQGSDLIELYRNLLGAQVLGLYDDTKKEFFVLQTGPDMGASEESTYAHEYVHRLQDAHFDLTALLASSKVADPASGAGRSDRESAISALIEGDAVNAHSVSRSATSASRAWRTCSKRLLMQNG